MIRFVRRWLLQAGLAAVCAPWLVPATAVAQSSPAPTPNTSNQPASAEDSGPELWAIHGQTTLLDQYHPAFRSELRGPNSLDPGSRGDETFDATLYAGIRPWSGAELWVSPEIDQGFGLDNTLGVAAFPSAEAYKVGAATPYVRLPRLFFRQTIDLGGAAQKIDSDSTVLGGHQTADHITLTIGKFSVGDVFDTNAYAHDPRQDFFNWALVDLGTFDYAADAWGYTYGFAAELQKSWWSLRAGGFALSRVPNSAALDTSGGQVQFIGEAEERHTLFGRDGKLKMLAFLTRGRMGDYGNAVALGQATETTPSVAAVRQYRSRSGIGLNVEQGITDTLGAFARAGLAEGGREPYEFTDTDRSLSAGLSLIGRAWGRPDDTVGLGAVVDVISRRHKQYLAAGGLGILIGDGSLPSAGPEQVAEAYYRCAVTGHAQVTADYQFINNPAYDRLRGPVSVLAFRLHIQY